MSMDVRVDQKPVAAAVQEHTPLNTPNPLAGFQFSSPATSASDYRTLAYEDMKGSRAQTPAPAPLKSSVDLGGVTVSKEGEIKDITFVDGNGRPDGQANQGYDNLKVKINGAAATNIVVALTKAGVTEYELEGKKYNPQDPASAKELANKLTEVESVVTKSNKSPTGTIDIPGKVVAPADFSLVTLQTTIPERSVDLVGTKVSVTEKGLQLSGLPFVDEEGRIAGKDQAYTDLQVRPFKSSAINITHALIDSGVEKVTLGDKEYDLKSPKEALKFIDALAETQVKVNKAAGQDKGTIDIPIKVNSPEKFKEGTVTGASGPTADA